MNTKPNKFFYFLMTFLVAVAILSFIAAVAINMINNSAYTSPPPEDLPTPTNYTPQAYDDLSVLFILYDDTHSSPYSFLLLGFYPSSGKIPVHAIPANTIIAHDKGNSTLSDTQIKFGSASTKMFLEGDLGVNIDRYFKISTSDFAKLIDVFGGTQYHLPEGIKLTSPFGEVTLNPGLQILDGKKLSSILSMGANDNEYAQLGAEVLATFINSKISIASPKTSEDFFTRALGLAETDLTYVDIEARKRPARFLQDLAAEPAYRS